MKYVKYVKSLKFVKSMTDRELNITLREMARSQGLCDDWYNAWEDDSTVDECIDRYIKGHDFAVKNNYPPIDFIRKYVDKDVLHKHNIFIDEEVDIDVEKSGYFVFLGECTGTLKASGFLAVTVYVRHDSGIKVISEDGAKVFVSIYEDADATGEHDEWSVVNIFNRCNK